jgi:hypothetical protein
MAMTASGGYGWDTSQTDPNDPNNTNPNDYNQNDGSGTWNDYQHFQPKLPQSTFPNVDASGGGGGVSYNPDKLTQVAKAMQDELTALNASNAAPANLKAHGTLPVTMACGPQVMFGWPTAAGFGLNANSATAGVLQFYNDLSNAYNTVIGNIHTTVSTYGNADQATQQAANNAGA